MYINHYETCGKYHGIHLGENCCPETVGQAQVITDFNNPWSDPKTGITPEYIVNPKLHFGSNSPDDLRALNYSVAVHNDYKLDGYKYTFWLITKYVEGQILAFKGEGETDDVALDQIRKQIMDKFGANL